MLRKTWAYVPLKGSSRQTTFLCTWQYRKQNLVTVFVFKKVRAKWTKYVIWCGINLGVLILSLNAPKCFIFECFIVSLFCAILTNLQGWMFLCGWAGICVDKLAGQLGASSETEPGNSLALWESEEVRQKYSSWDCWLGCMIFVDLFVWIRRNAYL